MCKRIDNKSFTYFILTLLFISIGLGNAYGQVNYDQIRLKNGSVIKGQILEFSPERPLKIRLTNGSEMEYLWAQIEKIELATENKEAAYTETKRAALGSTPNGQSGQSSIGGAFALRTTAISGTSNDSHTGIGVSGSALLQTFFAPQIAIVTGLGVNTYGDRTRRVAYLNIPLLFRFVTNVRPDRVGVNFDGGFNNHIVLSTGSGSPIDTNQFPPVKLYSHFSRSLVLGAGVMIPVTKRWILNTMLHMDANWASTRYASYAGIGVQMGLFYKFDLNENDCD